jgi:hypothetical protein
MPRARAFAAAGAAPPLRVQALRHCNLTCTVQKHEAAVKAAEAATIEESMISKDALSQAQAEFERYQKVLRLFFPTLTPPACVYLPP